MPFVKTDMIQEARELQEIFKDDAETKDLFKKYELAHSESEEDNDGSTKS